MEGYGIDSEDILLLLARNRGAGYIDPMAFERKVFPFGNVSIDLVDQTRGEVGNDSLVFIGKCSVVVEWHSRLLSGYSNVDVVMSVRCQILILWVQPQTCEGGGRYTLNGYSSFYTADRISVTQGET